MFFLFFFFENVSPFLFIMGYVGLGSTLTPQQTQYTLLCLLKSRRIDGERGMRRFSSLKKCEEGKYPGCDGLLLHPLSRPCRVIKERIWEMWIEEERNGRDEGDEGRRFRGSPPPHTQLPYLTYFIDRPSLIPTA